MRKPLSVLLCLCLCLLLLPFGSARATEGLAGAWQIDYADLACSMLLEAAANCILCHTTTPETNPYGQDVADFGFGWFVLEGVDSDGDERTNGEEIYNDCTLPGYSATPTDTTSWSHIKARYSK
jgi:hypothetical protein